MSIGRINRPGAPSGEQAHLEGLRDELLPGEWIAGGFVYRTQWTPATGGGYWAMPMIVRRIGPMPSPVEQAMAAARYLRERHGTPPWTQYLPSGERAPIGSYDEFERAYGPRPSMAVGEWGTIYSIEREPWPWWRRPRWAWRLAWWVRDR